MMMLEDNSSRTLEEWGKICDEARIQEEEDRKIRLRPKFNKRPKKNNKKKNIWVYKNG